MIRQEVTKIRIESSEQWCQTEYIYDTLRHVEHVLKHDQEKWLSSRLVDMIYKIKVPWLVAATILDRDVISEKWHVKVSCVPFVNKENLDKRS